MGGNTNLCGTQVRPAVSHWRSFCVSSKTAELSINMLSAEVKFAQFVAEHNLSFAVADHFTKLTKQLFPDSVIAGRFSSGRMKTTMIVKKALAPHLDAYVVKLSQNSQTKATTRVRRSLVILVKVFDAKTDHAATRFLDIPICNIGTGENIFNAIDDCLRYLFI
ncbi:hypothetical protein NP493_246g02099 [Ridgeia piscesae]|uniref:Uncharacterized protein n=1 Tax=Ridgeia piscesae TaxID=27915 RepID=A0AAD9NZ31_RIDPI|nr:hypothetical protein NP493_246g02099 [Ridgeia piscesae]